MFKIPKYQLYLFQLENYELGRYLKLLFKKGLLPPKEGLRKGLVWTRKAGMIFGLVLLTHAFLLIGLWYWIPSASWRIAGMTVKVILLLTTGYLLLYIYFIPYTLYSLLLWPIDFLLKKWIIFKAKSKILNLKSKIRIIGIAGSYGKTTMKEVLRQVLSSKHQVLSTLDSVNTPVGVARWILNKVDASTEIIIIEMGEHYSGDIIELCKLTPPDIGIITGINEAHLERMGSMEKVEATIFEIAQGMKPGGLLMLNGDDKIVAESYRKYVNKDQQVDKFQISNFKFQIFSTQSLYWECEHKDLGQFIIHLLGEYALGDVDCAVKIGKALGMNNGEIKQGVEKIRPVEHRLQPSYAPGNILVIDDAYNGNSDGAREAIKVLSRFKDRRKIYITPGLVETGSASRGVHLEIGRQLAMVADVVILIRNSVTGWIEKGIESVIAKELQRLKQSEPTKRLPRPSTFALHLRQGFGGQVGARNDKPKIILFNTAPEAHAELKNILQPNDIILFQNDWGDQYI
ncbi:MAG: UDP-N-acetylmuramoyl-tripeptide--D-alanyl-D-alanine ligase [Patescibacteria group bacterium]